ncbi:MAG: tubulin-like doman-containing protein, partial [Dehalococcoidia bacterium]
MGILNIYLGGSGKYIAEECKGTGEYYGIKMPEFVAFDLDTRPSHTGAYMLGDKLNTVPPNFGAEAKNSFGKQWANLNLGHALEPADGAAGPRLRPEAAIMRRTGRDTLELPAPADGLWGVRGSGLLAFAALLDPLMRRSSQTDAFLSNLLRGLREEGENNAPIAIHIYASTAGGTGAGMVLPLSLWLRRFALDNNFRANNITIRLFLCNSSTFDNEQAGSPEAQRQMITKGRSGTFAIMRELQLLEKIETEPTTFSRRWLPVKPDPIEYQLGSDVISGVYWIGRRDKDNEASKTDVYDEASLVARAVSNDQVAAGVSAMATQHKHKLAFSAASIEYPKRQIAQQMSGSVARRVFGELIEDPTAVPPRRRISEFGGPAPEDLAAFIHAEEETGVLARGVGDGRADRESMDTLVTSLSKPDETLDAVERGDADTKAIYTAPEENRGTWDDYCTRLFLRLDDVDRAAPGVAENRVRVDLAKHGPRFARWLNEKVVGEALNPPQQHEKPSAIATVRGSVEAIRTVVERIGAYFDPDASVTERVPDPGMQPGMEDWRYRPIADLKREIEEQKNSVLRPPPAERKTLGLGRLIGALLGGIVVAVGVWALLGLVISGVLQVVLAFVVGLLVFLVLTRLLRPTETLAERRVRQEDELFDLYRELLYAYTAAALFKLTRSVFVQEAQGQIRQTLQQLDNLQAVYKKLQDRVDERLAQGIPKPLHAVAQLRPQDDDQLEPSDHQSLTKAREIAPRVRARALVGSGGSLGDIEVQIIPDRTRRPDDLPATGQVSSLVEAVRRQTVGSDQTGYQAGQQELEGLDAAMDREATESLGTQLPSDFPSAAAAWLGMGAAAAPAIAGYLSALVHCTPAGNPQGTGVDRTSSSVELGRSNGGPVYRRLLVGDAAIIPLINEATPRVRGVAQERLSAFIRETAAETGTPALHCPQVGPA